MVALVVRRKIHRDDVFGTHVFVRKTGRRDQHAAGDAVRQIAGGALVEAAAVHLPAGVDNSLAKIGVVVVDHGACSERVIQDWYAAESAAASKPASASGATGRSATLGTGSVRANLRHS